MRIFLTLLIVASAWSEVFAQNQFDFEVFKKSELILKGDTALLASDWLNANREQKVLFFWATWCGPCIMEMEAVKEGIAEGKVDGLKLYFISDEKPEKIAAFVAKKNMQAINIVRVNTTAQNLGIYSIPFSLVINKAGQVEKTETGFYNKKHTLDFVAKYTK